MFKIVNKKQIPMLIVAVVALLAAVPMRVIQLYGNILMPSGFYKDAGINELVLFAVIAVSCLVFIIYNFLDRRRIKPFAKSRSRAVSFTGIAFALVLIWNFISGMMSFFEKINSVSDSLATASAIIECVQSVLALFAAFYIIIHAISYFGGTVNYRSFKLWGLTPCFWLASRLIGDFLIQINYIYVSQILFDIFMLIFAMMFFFNFAKMNACFKGGASYGRMFATGWCSVVLCTVVSLPVLINRFIPGTEAYIPFGAVDCGNLLMGIYIFVILIKCSVSKVKRCK